MTQPRRKKHRPQTVLYMPVTNHLGDIEWCAPTLTRKEARVEARDQETVRDWPVGSWKVARVIL